MRSAKQQIHFVPDFDLVHDYDLICASFLCAYNIRLRKLQYGDMSWIEFQTLLCNLPSYTPLCDVVSIRKTSQDELENLTEEELKIRQDWLEFVHKKIDNQEIVNDFTAFQNALQAAFSEGENKNV